MRDHRLPERLFRLGSTLSSLQVRCLHTRTMLLVLALLCFVPLTAAVRRTGQGMPALRTFGTGRSAFSIQSDVETEAALPAHRPPPPLRTSPRTVSFLPSATGKTVRLWVGSPFGFWGGPFNQTALDAMLAALAPLLAEVLCCPYAAPRSVLPTD